ncbi:hypothetical protein PHLCEN_2v12753 [Hermanssonia centrifuga]|uniref:Uncharacterized protein n=1 Tax=Hermanssonia centrifuga TaxID=98765 RepID=A0A2R6NG65_9APHY|nr:hypothetical protein PHLCEN_2v12753 [Hermanssonia centrifuga]
MYSIATRTALRRAAIAPISRATVVARGYSSSGHDNDPEVLEREKDRNMKNVQHKTSTPIRNAPGWNQYLASASEAAVKADRSDLPPHELADETVKYVKARHHEQESPMPKPEDVPGSKEGLTGEERPDAYEASYEKDDLTGPLKNSPKDNVQREVYKEKVSKNDTDTSGGM